MPKRLELLKEAIPNASRVTLIQDPEAATNAFELLKQAAPRLGITMQSAQIAAEEGLTQELATVTDQRPDALLVYPDVVLSSRPGPAEPWRFRAKGQAAHRTCVPLFRRCWRSHVLSYGATTTEIYTSAAEQVAKILDGARPSELPLRQATRFELIINNRTAKALGITLPPSLLARADEVIE